MTIWLQKVNAAATRAVLDLAGKLQVDVSDKRKHEHHCVHSLQLAAELQAAIVAELQYELGWDIADGISAEALIMRIGGADETEAKQPFFRVASAYKAVVESRELSVQQLSLNRDAALAPYVLHGNVWAWCADGLRAYADRPEVDPAGPLNDDRRVVRGGAWSRTEQWARSAYRIASPRGGRDDLPGFRFPLRPAEPSQPQPAKI